MSEGHGYPLVSYILHDLLQCDCLTTFSTLSPINSREGEGINNHVLSNTKYLTLRSVSSLNNPQNSEMKFCENMKLTC
jgi:hypothetical protein